MDTKKALDSVLKILLSVFRFNSQRIWENLKDYSTLKLTVAANILVHAKWGHSLFGAGAFDRDLRVSFHDSLSPTRF